MEGGTAAQRAPEEEAVSSFSKSLFLGEIHEELVFPFPKPDPDEQDRIRSLITALREMPYDSRKIEEDRWIGDDTIREMGERGLLGLYVPEEYGGQGLSQTGYCRVQGRRNGVPLVCRQPRAAAGRRHGIHARPAVREAPARHPHLPDLRGLQRRHARLHRARRHEARRRRAEGARRREPRRPGRLDRRAGRLRSGADHARGAPRPHHQGPRRADDHAAAVADQVKRLRSVTESLLREHKGDVMLRQFHQKRLAAAVSDIYAQVATLSRTTEHLNEHGVEPSGQEQYITETFCRRAAGRVKGALDHVESNDDERMVAIAKLAYKRGEYGYAFFED